MRLRLLTVAIAATAPLTLAGIAVAAPGDLSVQPSSGPAGTSVTATGECPAPPGESADPFGAVVLLDGEQPIAGGEGSLSSDATFTVTFEVPGDAAPGDYEVAGACFAGNSDDEDPYSELTSDTFTVTGADTGTVTIPVDPDTGGGGAPVATPVDGTPRFTG